MYRPVLVTPPASTPVTLAEAKVHCRANDHTDDDDTLRALISAAVSYLDGWTGILGRCLVEQTWRQDFGCFFTRLPLPLFPVISITDVKYFDSAGAEQTIDPAAYSLQVNDLGAYVRFVDGFSAPALRSDEPAVGITYKAGYANSGEPATSTVPDAIKHAILLLVSHWYQNRDAVVIGQQPTELPMAVSALLAPYRRMKF
ncbi:MAG: hypothetical protein E6Q77_01730 [Rhizobium sp.]|nr:MAG: hypothetical protein E6Q77_01730 [Rhizobium sp.]